MTRRPPTTETRIALRTILSAGVLAMLLACAGTAAGATTWVVDDGGGADFTSIQAAVDAAMRNSTLVMKIAIVCLVAIFFGLHRARWRNGETSEKRTGVERLSGSVRKGCDDVNWIGAMCV